MEAYASTGVLSVGNLHQVGGVGLTHSLDANTYVVLGDPTVMIECGGGFGYPELKRRLGEKGVKIAEIDTVLATHGHLDHYNGIHQLFQEGDAKLFMPTEDADGVECGDTNKTVAYYYGQEARPAKVAGTVDDNFCLQTSTAKITAIKTPWHTLGSVCYRVEQEDSVTLVAADTLYAFYFPSPGRNIYDDIDQGRESITRLRQESFDFMAIGHAVLGFMNDVATRLEEAERQFASPSVFEFIKENAGNLPIYVDPWRKVPGQAFKY